MAKTFNKQVCRLLAPKIIAELDKLAKKIGVKFESHGGNYSDFEWIMKLRVSLSGEAGEEAARVQWKTNCGLFNLKPADFGKTVTYGRGKTKYKVVGLQLSRSKYPVKVERWPDGKIFLLPTDAVRPSLQHPKLGKIFHS